MNKQNINEAIEKFGKDAIEAVDPTYAQALKDKEIFQANKDAVTKEKQKEVDEVVKINQPLSHSIKKNAQRKKLFLGESLDTETKQYKRYTFNIQVLPTDDLNVDYLSMTAVPENVLEKLSDEIKNYAVNQVVIYNDEFEDQSEEITEHLGDGPVIKVEHVKDFEPWNQAVRVYELIFNAGKLDQLQGVIEDLYPEGITEEELNDLLWTEDDWLLSELKIEVKNDN